MGFLGIPALGLIDEAERVAAEIMEAIRRVRFGQVVIFIQDGKVMQIDRTEKIRLGGEGGVKVSRDSTARRRK